MGGIDKIKGRLGGLVSFATGPVAAAMAGIGAGASIAGMVGLAASIEQTETQFKTLLGSVEASKKMITELQQFGASTPFEFAGLAESAKTLLAFGTSNDQIIPTMQILGDVAAATGSDIGELASIYGKVAARGALMTESLDQFNERGIPIGKLLAETMGKSGEEIRQMASDGQISFGMMQSAMQKMASEGGIAFNGMADQSQTLGGLFSTLKDSATILMGDIGAAIVEGFDLKGAVANLSGFVDRFRGEWMPSIVDAMQWATENMILPVSNFVGHASALVGDLVGNFDLYFQYAYTSIGNTMNNMYQHVATFFDNAVTIGSWWYENILTMFGNAYNNVGRIFGNLIQQIKNNWQSLLDFFTTGELKFDFSPIADSFKAVIEGIEPPKLKTAETDAMAGDLERIGQQISDRNAAREEARKKASSAIHETKMAEFKIEEKAAVAAAEAPAKKGNDQKDSEKKLVAEKKITAEKEKQRNTSFVSLAELTDKMQESIASRGGQGTGPVGELLATPIRQETATALGGTGDASKSELSKVAGLFKNFDDAKGLSPVQTMANKGGASIVAQANSQGPVAELGKQVELLQSLLSLATGSGFKMVPMEKASVPQASVKFGVTGA